MPATTMQMCLKSTTTMQMLLKSTSALVGPVSIEAIVALMHYDSTTTAILRNWKHYSFMANSTFDLEISFDASHRD